MAAGRKLQAEIEKVLKKVEEGIEEFNNVWDNVHSAVHANQREKFETELKTQIKKLQRDREQIKIWHSDKSIKDKVALAEARKKIEVEMERFKEFERDSKTKQYSKEGLSKSDKVDPHEEERGRHRTWIQEYIDKLHMQIDEIDADAEAALSTKKAKNSKQDDSALQHLRLIQDSHRWHATKLEQLLRKLDNDDVAMSELDDLRDSVEYYADENSRTAGEFQPFDTIYEAFCLEDVEDYLTKDRDKGLDKDDDKDDESKSVGTAAASEGSKSETRREEEPPKAPTISTPQAPTKHTGGTAAAAKARSAQRSSKEDGGESSSQPQKAWPPMVSVWQNPPTAEREKAPLPDGVPPSSSPGQPVKPGPPVPRPAPTLPPPMQPAPDRPPPPGQAPVLNAPPNQPPPKPAAERVVLVSPTTMAPAPTHPLPSLQPPTQAPPQPPVPSPPAGSPPRPQAVTSPVVPPVAGSPNGSLPAALSAAVMPAPPPMPPPAPQDAPASGPGAVAAVGQCAGPPGTSQPPQPTMSEPPATAPPPPPPPVLPPPPPSPAPAPSGPPSTTPLLPAVHAKAAATSAEVEATMSWPPPVPCLSDEHLQQTRKVPPPTEAPPPPAESPPPPPPEAPGPTAVAEAAATSVAPLESRAYVTTAASSPAMSPPAAYEPGSGLPPPPPPAPSVASRPTAVAARPMEPPGPIGAPEVRSQLSPRKLDALDLLSASHRHLPAPSDGRRNRKYAPRNPYVHTDQNGNAAYPLQPTAGYEDPAMFKKYDLDTLFFIFYYQQGSYQQHLAAKELKKLSWRYHTKYLTWFQRHEEPRMAASDFERGAYVYFDHETGWCQRIKSDFTFEYQYLEDEPVSG